jgi:hypothetical protein
MTHGGTQYWTLRQALKSGLGLRMTLKTSTRIGRNWPALCLDCFAQVLNFIEKANSVNPEFTFKPKGAFSSPTVNTTFVR